MPSIVDWLRKLDACSRCARPSVTHLGYPLSPGGAESQLPVALCTRCARDYDVDYGAVDYVSEEVLRLLVALSEEYRR